MADWTGLRQTINNWAIAVAQDAIENTYRETLAEAPEDTGFLKSQIVTSGPRALGSLLQCEITSKAHYSGYTDTGTRPHVIAARNAPLLVFYWPKIGGMFYGKRVNHPGTKGTQWFNNGRDGGSPMAERWRRALEDAMRDLS